MGKVFHSSLPACFGTGNLRSQHTYFLQDLSPTCRVWNYTDETSTIVLEIQQFEGKSEQLLTSNVDLSAKIVKANDFHEVDWFHRHMVGNNETI